MEKVNIDPFKLIGIAIKTTNQKGQAAREIAELWDRFLNDKIAETIPNKSDTNVYSMYTDYEGDHTKPYTAILGCKVNSLENIPEGMIGKSFDGGTYIKTSARGDLMQGLVLNKWSEIFEMNLDRAYKADFELFGEKAQNPSDAEVDFYVGLKN